MNSLPQDFAQHAFNACEPLKALIELTTLCNYKCGHCYNFDRRDPNQKGIKGLSSSEVGSAIDQLAEMGVIELTLSGGEPALRKDLPDLIQHAANHRMFVKIKSNGSQISPELLNRLLDAGLTDLDVTLYGLTAQTHDRFTGAKGSFEKAVSLLKDAALRRPKLNLIVKVSMLEHSAHEAHLKNSLGKEIGVQIETQSACNNRNDFSTGSKQFQQNLHAVEGLSSAEIDSLQAQLHGGGDASTFRCGCARISMAIMANGDIVPCVEAPWRAGNIRNEAIRDVWKNSKVFNSIRGLEAPDWSVCNGCALTRVCSRRNCSAFKHKGIYTDPDPDAGLRAYNKFRILGIDEPPCLK